MSKKSTTKSDIRNNSAYEANDGFSTSIWGDPMWHILHIISFNYPVKPTAADKDHYKMFICSLEHVLPCAACRRNYKQNLIDLNFSKKDLQDRHHFSRFVYKLRQEINHRIGAGELPMSYYKTRNAYECFRAKCGKPKKGQKEDGCIWPKKHVKSRTVMRIAPVTELKHVPSLQISRGSFQTLM